MLAHILGDGKVGSRSLARSLGERAEPLTRQGERTSEKEVPLPRPRPQPAGAHVCVTVTASRPAPLI